MDKNILRLTLKEQFDLFTKQSGFIDMDIPKDIYKTKKITAIIGVRRSGKSTLMSQISKNVQGFYYLNFEDEAYSIFPQVISTTLRKFSLNCMGCRKSYFLMKFKMYMDGKSLSEGFLMKGLKFISRGAMLIY